MDEIHQLASILEGEAGTCGILAMIAVAHVFSRNKTMYGHDSPSGDAILIAENWYRFTDMSNGAVFVFNDADLKDSRVRRLIGRSPPVQILECADNEHLNFFTGEANEN